jgi:Type II secretion system (T2SS), protein G
MANSIPHARGVHGFSVAEVLTILTAFTILGGLTAPAIYDYIEDARGIRARHDVTTIAVSLVRLFDDVGSESGRPKGWASFDLLVGAGVAPAAGQDQASAWAIPADASGVGLIDDQLVRNAAEYTRHRTSAMIGWRGPYVQKTVDADPWGHRYAVNVRALRTTGADTFVLSAGPDGVVTTPFDSDGLSGARDDIAALVSSSGLGP